MNNKGLKPGNIENNQESLLLRKIRKLEESVAELMVENEKLRHDLMHDYLTKLNSRQYLEERLEETISSLKNPEKENRKDGVKTFSLLFCDIDNFKNINDTFGHLGQNGGDAVLIKISEIINQNVRVSDVVCRWSGDEIVVGLFGADEKEAVKIAEKIRIAIEEGMKDLGVTMSIGAVSYEEGLDIKSITERADMAMYWAKKEGKNKVIKYSGVLKAEKETKEKK